MTDRRTLVWPSPTELGVNSIQLLLFIYLLDRVHSILYTDKPATTVVGGCRVREGRGVRWVGGWRLTGAVEVAVSDAERGEDEGADGGLLHPPDAQPHRGHPVAAAQRHRRRGALGRHAPLDSAAAAALLLGFSAALRLALLSLPPCCLRCNLG